MSLSKKITPVQSLRLTDWNEAIEQQSLRRHTSKTHDVHEETNDRELAAHECLWVSNNLLYWTGNQSLVHLKANELLDYAWYSRMSFEEQEERDVFRPHSFPTFPELWMMTF